MESMHRAGAVFAALAILMFTAASARAACPAGTVQIGEQRETVGNTIIVHPICQRVRQQEAPPPLLTDERVTLSLVAMAQRWDPDELRRLASALSNLRPERVETGDAVQVRLLWALMRGVRRDGGLVDAAAVGHGPPLFAVGRQSSEDCAIFALATATGHPYGVVAAAATAIIEQADYRSAEERNQPQLVFESASAGQPRRAGGLNGGEVVMLAEAFGQVEIVTPSMFAATLQQGRAVMIGVVAPGGRPDEVVRHQVVLSRTFLHDGAVWYEMIDSNEGPQRRLYLRADELRTILTENGVTYRPEPARTPHLLR